MQKGRFHSLIAGLGATLIFVAATRQAPWEFVRAAGVALRSYWIELTIGALGITFLTVGLFKQLQPTGNAEPSAAPLPPDRQLKALPQWAIPLGAVMMIAVTGVAVWWLQATTPAVGTDVQRAQLRITAIRTGLSVGAGAAGAVALLLALRRQQLAERTQQATEYDAGEKRVTELYVKAADQLGSDKAPVRLAGLYALERVAQDNPTHRQSIVDVICAYLRIPGNTVNGTSRDDTNIEANLAYAEAEQQVRITAQRILTRHLRIQKDGEPNIQSWPNVSVDLTNATLVKADFSGCRLTNAVFNNAYFDGHANFDNAVFVGTAFFDDAAFDSDATFSRASFDSASFDSTKFTEGAHFADSIFRGVALFMGTTFEQNCSFANLKFEDSALFVSASFSGSTYFTGSKFQSEANFHSTEFGIHTIWHKAHFAQPAVFEDVKFAGNVDLKTVTVGHSGDGAGRSGSVWPTGWHLEEGGRLVCTDGSDRDPPRII
ncbi:pentapeptide repeat-containing protein [Micromonospora echinofusca]|uniref:pentapeptide repeat-containing protein n=1 Tax=Micromonospora echinofusca TaxID=47858 RepID=UPI00341D0583